MEFACIAKHSTPTTIQSEGTNMDRSRKKFPFIMSNPETAYLPIERRTYAVIWDEYTVPMGEMWASYADAYFELKTGLE